jgi:uncharacterized protein
VLSRENFEGRSVAALGTAAHECGHAIQHKAAYAPLQWRMAAVGLTSFASQLVMRLPLVGMFTGLLSTHTGLLIMARGWGIIMPFDLITLPVEFDASRRAKRLPPAMGFIQSREELGAVRKVLNAAAWTYVAAFLTSLAYFLWHLLPLLLGGQALGRIARYGVVYENSTLSNFEVWRPVHPTVSSTFQRLRVIDGFRDPCSFRTKGG